MLFEWDDQIAAHNLQKHHVSFQEAATIFGDPWALTFDDPDHSADEQRFITIGESERRRVLLVSHTDRDDITRIISARKATRQERRAYENERSA
jgi:uncharacterized protein